MDLYNAGIRVTPKESNEIHFLDVLDSRKALMEPN